VDGTAIEGRSASEVLSDIGAAPAAGSSNIVTTGALNSGSITSGFSSIDVGGGNITTTGVGSFGSLDISGDIDVDGTTNLDVVDIDGAVDMASTLGVAGVVTANAGVVVDNFTLDGTTLSLSSGDMTLDVEGEFIVDVNLQGEGNGILLKDDGTLYGNIFRTGSDLVIMSSASDEDLIFKGNDGGSTITALTFDMSAAGAAAFNAGATFADTCTITTADNTSQLILKSTDADDAGGPGFDLLRDSSSPANSDDIGYIRFRAKNSNGDEHTYGFFQAKALTVTDGSEDGGIELLMNKGGSNRSRMEVLAGETVFNEDSVDVDFRVESNGNANMLTVNAGEDKVGIGRDPATGVLDLLCAGSTANQAIRIADSSPTEYFGVFNANSGANAPNSANATLKVRGMTSTNRAINAGGTVNASGADYAEYMTKADGCGTIAKGAVCGVDSDGKLTDVFAEAHSFVIKSTDPSYVGGDVWSLASTDSYGNQTTLEGDALETARQRVDRIAFSGQVPCTITGTTKVGDFVIAQAKSDGGIEAVAVTSPTFEQYSVAVGKVWKLGSSQHTVAVKIG